MQSTTRTRAAAADRHMPPRTMTWRSTLTKLMPARYVHTQLQTSLHPVLQFHRSLCAAGVLVCIAAPVLIMVHVLSSECYLDRKQRVKVCLIVPCPRKLCSAVVISGLLPFRSCKSVAPCQLSGIERKLHSKFKISKESSDILFLACRVQVKRYTPFGQGVRNCLGQQLARMNVPTAVAMFMSEFEFTVAPQVRACF